MEPSRNLKRMKQPTVEYKIFSGLSEELQFKLNAAAEEGFTVDRFACSEHVLWVIMEKWTYEEDSADSCTDCACKS